MKKIRSLIRHILIVLAMPTIGIVCALNAQVKQPKLVVGIVVDQMRNDYLYRFYDDFSSGGFRRMMKEGFTYHNMHFNYMPTFTAPGHASIYTGSTPTHHAIIGNTFFHRSLGRNVYCTEDKTVHPLGEVADSTEGKMSPTNMIASTITDELKLATNFRGKVIGMSIKDRGAILPAGHLADRAYWMSSTGNFVSSDFYGPSLPDWVVKFNNEKRYESYLKKGWDLSCNPSVYDESTEDNSPFEGKLMGRMDPVFPYNLWNEYINHGAEVIKSTPYGNDILADFAIKAIISENLGVDPIPDFLTISFSSTDYIGHKMGPRSRELQDTYLRLDKNLEDLFSFLDKKVGKGNYLVFLTADHACNENPDFLNSHGYHIDNIEEKALRKIISETCEKNFGHDLVLNYSNQNIYLNRKKISDLNLDFNLVVEKLKEKIKDLDYIRMVYTEKDLTMPSVSDKLVQDIARGYDPKINGDLVILLRPGFMEYGNHGTTHGSPYNYDTHVPALFFGCNVPIGESFRRVEISQIAPTISQHLRITMPNSTYGNVLEEIISKSKH